MTDYSFTRYLTAKKAIDDRSLNQYVWRTLQAGFSPGPLDVLEVGAGTGTMIDRLVAWGLPEGGLYTAVDADPALVAAARGRFTGIQLPFQLELEAADVYEFARRERGRRRWDLLIAHAFLDLLDVPRLLPDLFALLRPGGLFYFTISFDGLTALDPLIDPEYDELVIEQYHRTMEERRLDGRPTGGRHAGRLLLRQIPAAGGEIMAAGSSDWIVLPGAHGYSADEAYFLHYILHFFESSLTGRSGLDPTRFAAWLAGRHEQIDAAELMLIVHQIDMCGRVAGGK